MADANYDCDDEASLTAETGQAEMDELLLLLEQKDSDLRRAAEFGKMLLDEKEADAEAHEGEKEALWRRIQDMARRVMELEQEAAKSRDEFTVRQEQHQYLAPASGDRGGFHRRLSVGGGIGGGGGSDRAEERALRAKNEMLERQLAHMKDEAEEAQLELAAARKARFFRRPSQNLSRGRSGSLLSSPALSSRLDRGDPGFSGDFSAALRPLSPARSLSPGPFPASAAAAASGGSVAGGSSAPVTPIRRHRRISMFRVSSPGRLSRMSEGGGVRGEGDKGEDEAGGVAGSAASKDEPQCAGDRVQTSASHARIEDTRNSDSDHNKGPEEGDRGLDNDEHDAAWLREQNAWLMEELEAKDELIEALREQLEQQQQQSQQQRRGGNGPWTSSSMHSLRDPEGSDDSDENSDDGDQRSFLDHLLHESGGEGGKRVNQPRVSSPTDKSLPTITTNGDGAVVGPKAVAGTDEYAVGRGGQTTLGAAPEGHGKSPTSGGVDRDGENFQGDGSKQAVKQQQQQEQQQGGKSTAGLGDSAEQQQQQHPQATTSPARSCRRQSAGGVPCIERQDDVAGVAVSTAGAAAAVAAPLPEAARDASAETKQQPPAAGAVAKTPAVAEPETTVRARKKAAAAAKVRAKQQEEEQAAAAEEEARSTSPPFAQMSRNERKSRQAVEKLGLRAVRGVFRVTMRTSNGVVFVVKKPDVFSHPHQDTFIVFGTAETDRSGSEVRTSAQTVLARETTSVCTNGKETSAKAAMTASRPDPIAVERESVSAGLDPADVLTLISQVGCSSRAAIEALRQADGDVIYAAMDLMDASGAAIPS